MIQGRVDISELAKVHGAHALVFTIPVKRLRHFGPLSFTDGDDEGVLMECRADEESRGNRKVAEGYKILLRPTDSDYGYEEFYQMDLESLMRRHPDRFSMRVEIPDER